MEGYSFPQLLRTITLASTPREGLDRKAHRRLRDEAAEDLEGKARRRCI